MKRAYILVLLLMIFLGSTLAIWISYSSSNAYFVNTFHFGDRHGEEQINTKLDIAYKQITNLLNTNVTSSWTSDGSTVTTVSYNIHIAISADNVLDSYEEIVKLKAVRSDDTSKYWIWLDNTSTKSGISSGTASSTYIGDTTVANLLETHLGATQSGSYTVDFYVYCKITATGSITGTELIAELPWSKFQSITFSWQADEPQRTSFASKNIKDGTESGGSLSSTNTEDGATYNLAAEYYNDPHLPELSAYKVTIDFYTSSITGTFQKVYIKFKYSTASIDKGDWFAYKGDGTGVTITSAKPTSLTEYTLDIDNSYKDSYNRLKISLLASDPSQSFTVYIDYLALEYLPGAAWFDTPGYVYTGIFGIIFVLALVVLYHGKKRRETKRQK